MRKKLTVVIVVLLSSWALVGALGGVLGGSGQALAAEGTIKPVFFPVKWGFMDITGKLVIGRKYEWVSAFHEGLAAARLNGKEGFIDKTGKTVIPFQYLWAGDFHEGLAKVNVGGKIDSEEPTGGKWGYIDKTGKMVIEPKFASVEDFSQGFAVVKTFDQVRPYAYINSKGNFAFPVRFDSCFSFTDDWTMGNIDGQAVVLDKKGNINPQKIKVPAGVAESGFHDGLALFSAADPTLAYDDGGFLNKNMAYVVKPRYVEARPFAEGMAAVYRQEENWGFVNKQGKLVTELKYCEVWDFSSGLAKVEVEGEIDSVYGYIDKNGKEVIPANFAYAGNFSDGLAWVFPLDGPAGYIDCTGKMVLEFPKNVDCYDFSEGLARVATYPLWGFVDDKGKVVVQPQFTGVDNFDANGLAKVWKHTNWFGYIDRTGKTIVPAELVEALDFEDSVLVGLTNYGFEGFVVYNNKGELLKSGKSYLQASYPKSNIVEGVQYVLTDGGLNMRKEPVTSAAKIAVLSRGARVKVLEKTNIELTVDGIAGHWEKVSYQDKTGYVFDGYLSGYAGPPEIANYDENGTQANAIVGEFVEEEYSFKENELPMRICVSETGILYFYLATDISSCIEEYLIPGISMREAFLMVRQMVQGSVIRCNGQSYKSIPLSTLKYPGEKNNQITIDISDEGADYVIEIYPTDNGYTKIRLNIYGQ